jgi:hypothetical protein
MATKMVLLPIMRPKSRTNCETRRVVACVNFLVESSYIIDNPCTNVDHDSIDDMCCRIHLNYSYLY